MNTTRKILIIRLSSIGDIVLTSPVVRCLKKQIPNAEIHFCTKSKYAYLVEENPHIDKIHVLKGSMKPLLRKLKSEKFDFVVDLHDNIRTLRIKLALKAPSATYDKLRYQRQMLALLRKKMPKPSHVTDRYLATVSALGVVYDGEGLDYFIPQSAEIAINKLPETHQHGYVAFVIGGTAFTKILPAKKVIEMCDRINKPIILLGGPEDYGRGEEISSFFEVKANDAGIEKGLAQLGKKAVVYNACGKFSVHQSASIIKQASVVFANDTGLAHIAAAFKKTIYSIWGGTVPLYFYPYETRFFILENKNLSCRPCSKNGRKSCPKKHFKCMNEISMEFPLDEF